MDVLLVSQHVWVRGSREAEIHKGVQTARDIILREAPHLVVCDLDLFDGSGLEVVACAEIAARERGNPRPRFALIVEDRAAVDRADGRAQLWIRARPTNLPIFLSDLRSLPVPPTPTLADYCSFATLGHRPVVITVSDPAGIVLGSVRIRSDREWTASDADGLGADAFGRLLEVPAPRIECRALTDELVAHPIPFPLRTLLADVRAPLSSYSDSVPPSSRGRTPPSSSFGGVSGPRPFRAQDREPSGRALFVGSASGPISNATIPGLAAVVATAQAVRAAKASPPPAPVPSRVPTTPLGMPVPETPAPAPVAPPAPTPPAAAVAPVRTFAEVWENAIDAMLRRDYPRAVVVLKEALELRPSDAQVTANLERLRRLGFE